MIVMRVMTRPWRRSASAVLTCHASGQRESHALTGVDTWLPAAASAGASRRGDHRDDHARSRAVGVTTGIDVTGPG